MVEMITEMPEEKSFIYVVMPDIWRRMMINTFLGMATIMVSQVVSQNGRPNSRLITIPIHFKL